MNPEDLSRLRQGVYRLLGAGLSHPTQEMLTAAGGSVALLDELGLFAYSFAPDFADACEMLSRANIDDLSVAYVSLFEAGVAGASCSPHESAYRSDPRTGQVAELVAQLKRTILRYGLKLEAAQLDMVDHIGIELEIMAWLCRRESENMSEKRPVTRTISNQKEFLEEHLLPWAPAFADKVRSLDAHPAYSALAMALRSFLSNERQLVPLLVMRAEDQQ